MRAQEFRQARHDDIPGNAARHVHAQPSRELPAAGDKQRLEFFHVREQVVASLIEHLTLGRCPNNQGAEMSKIALITGGSRGLGKNAALKLAAKGVDVILTYRSQQAEAQGVVAEIERMGRRALALPLDAADSAGFSPFAA